MPTWVFIPAHGVWKTDFPLGNASTRLAQTAPRSTEHACCRGAASELLAGFWLFFHCCHVTSGLTKAGLALLELGLQELCSCWRITGAGVLKALSSQWEPQGMEGPIRDLIPFSKLRLLC